MKDLESLQRAFQRHVYRPGRAMERAVLEAPRANAARRLGIYADAYRSRLVEALASDYPALKEVLGESRFDRLMRAFVAAHPSRTPNLRWYGGELARFLGHSSRGRGRRPLAELARFEWALGLAFDAQDAPLVGAEDAAVDQLAAITGQKPVIRRARKSIANFKVRKDMPIGCTVTLRGDRMYDFFDRLVSIALPRVRDFRGLPSRSFDGRGNYTLGLKDQLVFLEIDYAKVDKVHGMNVTLVTTAKTDEEARNLLTLLGMPFRKD